MRNIKVIVLLGLIALSIGSAAPAAGETLEVNNVDQSSYSVWLEPGQTVHLTTAPVNFEISSPEIIENTEAASLPSEAVFSIRAIGAVGDQETVTFEIMGE